MTVIHILSSFKKPNGGGWQAIDMYLEMRKLHQVFLWGHEPPNADFDRFPIRVIKPYKNESPHGGTLYVCGANINIGHWYEQAMFENIVLIHNMTEQRMFYHTYHRLSMQGTKEIQIEYVSALVKNYIGLAGNISHPLPHPERFRALPVNGQKNSSRPFTIGRISRDVKSKHHPHDILLYKKLAALGINIKIVGGTCLKPWLDNISNISLLPEMPQSEIPELLSTFDCFYYRVSRIWREAFGLVVAEAISSGLPVVAYDDGGYTEWLNQQQKGFLFKNHQEAFEIIKKLAMT